MRINLKSEVAGNYKDVFRAFDQMLFEYLLPPGAKVIQFDGSEKGNLVHLSFSFPPGAKWISEIVEDSCSENLCYFIDVGKVLPFGIKHWKHRHLVHKKDNDSVIEDDIEFSTGNSLYDRLLYPFLYLSFLPRISQYKSYFKKLNKT